MYFHASQNGKIAKWAARAAMPIAAAIFVSLYSAAAQSADTDIEIDINAQIDQESRGNKQTEILVHELINAIGPRLSNSPQMRLAETWAVDKFRSWGLDSVNKEGFYFGPGWSVNSASVHLIAPRKIALNAIPVAWSKGSKGTISGNVILLQDNMDEPQRLSARVKDKIVMVGALGNSGEPRAPLFRRFSDNDLAEFDRPTAYPYRLGMGGIGDRFERRDRFFRSIAEAGAKAILIRSMRDGQLLHGDGLWINDNRLDVPIMELSAEDYRRVAALSLADANIILELNSDVNFHTQDENAYNIIGQIDGSDPGAAYVMVGAHYDSWAAGDGATDNGAGMVMVMEAARILAALNVKPKRSIKFALWAAEEQGLFGSRAYAEKYLVSRPAAAKYSNPIADFLGWVDRFPLTKKAGYDDMKAYFNIDNGSGVIRGLYGAGDRAALPILNQWLIHSDIKAYIASPPGISDDVIMHSLGLPSYKFIQDPLDYSMRTHHTNADTFDHLRMEDIDKSSVIIAKILWAAANSVDEIPVRAFPSADEK